jgi:hypothetical protein
LWLPSACDAQAPAGLAAAPPPQQQQQQQAPPSPAKKATVAPAAAAALSPTRSAPYRAARAAAQRQVAAALDALRSSDDDGDCGNGGDCGEDGEEGCPGATPGAAAAAAAPVKIEPPCVAGRGGAGATAAAAADSASGESDCELRIGAGWAGCDGGVAGLWRRRHSTASPVSQQLPLDGPEGDGGASAAAELLARLPGAALLLPPFPGGCGAGADAEGLAAGAAPHRTSSPGMGEALLLLTTISEVG